VSKTDTYTVTVGEAPDFGISVSPTSGSAAQGGSNTATVAISSVGGFSGPVTITVGYPSGSGLTFAISSNPMSAPSSATLYIYTSSSTPTGTYTLTITGTSGSLTHSCTYTLTVTAAPKTATQMVVTTAPPSNVTVGQQFTFAGYLRDVNGNRLAGKTYVLNINGQDYATTGTTNSTGEWGWTISVGATGTYAYYCKFPGDSAYEGC
jgi:hypothetical protein